MAYTIDAAGNLTSDGLRTFRYDAANRLDRVRILKDGEAANIDYLHNAMGQRVFKSEPEAQRTLPNKETLSVGFIDWLKANFGWMFTAQATTSIGTAFVYGDGVLPPYALLGEYDNGSASGAGRTEYIYLPTDDGSAMLMGIYRNGRFFSVHTDHLGTPRLMKNDVNKVVWQRPYSAFGMTPPTGILQATAKPKEAVTNEPRLLKATVPAQVLNMRESFQYEDAETGMRYNLWRTLLQGYRYTQMDPIGLAGGLNRPGYANQNPLNNTDPTGEIVIPAFLPLLPLVPVACYLSPGCRDLFGPTYAKPPENAYDPDGPKAPGKPTEADGFKEPRGGEQWVPNPNPGTGGSSYGWKDAKGDVWCPTGPEDRSKGISHGGPHWDAQTPGGRSRNVIPQR